MAKGAQAKAAKAESEANKSKASQAAAEAAEEAKWSKGAKGKGAKEDKDDKAASAAAKKAEKARLEAEEEAELEKLKPKAPAKKAADKQPAKKAPVIPDFSDAIDRKPQVQEFSASGLDDALDMLDIATSKTDKATTGSKAAKIDTHPERRFKAAFEAYKERELPILKQERKGLRLQQYNDLLFKSFQKDPSNPFNAPSLSYDSSQKDKVELLTNLREETEARYRVDA